MMKGVCELIVARGLTKRVVLTRLPPGHTHEDIDAVFGKIWKYLAKRTIYTPQGYRRALIVSLRKRNIDVHVEDILCVPDYMQFMAPYIDPNLARCDKEKWSELQWTFDTVERSELYPHGVKVTYRKFSAPEVFVIHELKKPKEKPVTENGDENRGEEKEAEKETTEEKLWKDASPEEREFGFGWRKYRVNTHPVIEKKGDIDGMYLLQSLPDGTRQFQPQPFVRESRKELEKLVALTLRKFGDVPGVRGEWES